MRRVSLRALRSQRGATAVEFIVILVLTALLVLGMVRAFGGTVKGKFTDAQSHVHKGAKIEDSGSTGDDEDGAGAQKEVPRDVYGNPIQKSGSGVGKNVKRYSADDKLYRHEALQKKKARSKFGINPIVILILLFLIGLLVYVVFKGNKG